MTILSELLDCICDFLGLSKKKEMKQINDNIYIENGEWDQYPCRTEKHLHREYDAELESVKKSLVLIDGGKCCSDCKCDEGGCGGGSCGEGCEGSCESKKAEVVKLPVKEKRMVYHVVSNPEGGWLVKKEKNKNPSVRADTKHEAVAKAKELAKKTKLGQVIVHKKDGKIQTEYTYGEDPVKTKG